jgi:hypothetical protein
MTASDWDLIIRDGAMVMTTIIIPFAIWAYQQRTGVQVTDQQRAAVNATVATAAGIIQTQIDQGLLKVADVHADYPAIQQQAVAALKRVPDSAASQGTTLATIADKIVATVDTSPKPPVVVMPAIAPAAPSIPAA